MIGSVITGSFNVVIGGQPAAHKTAIAAHAGPILNGASKVQVNSLASARITDTFTCPMSDGPKPHVGGKIMPPGCPNVVVEGLPAARMGDVTLCSGPPQPGMGWGSGEGEFAGRDETPTRDCNGKPINDQEEPNSCVVANCRSILQEMGCGRRQTVGVPKMKPVLDPKTKKPVLDDDGKPKMAPVLDKEGNPVMEPVKSREGEGGPLQVKDAPNEAKLRKRASMMTDIRYGGFEPPPDGSDEKAYKQAGNLHYNPETGSNPWGVPAFLNAHGVETETFSHPPNYDNDPETKKQVDLGRERAKEMNAIQKPEGKNFKDVYDYNDAVEKYNKQVTEIDKKYAGQGFDERKMKEGQAAALGPAQDAAMADIKKATAEGRPVIAGVDSTKPPRSPPQTNHCVIIDKITGEPPNEVVHIRNPAPRIPGATGPVPGCQQIPMADFKKMMHPGGPFHAASPCIPGVTTQRYGTITPLSFPGA